MKKLVLIWISLLLFSCLGKAQEESANFPEEKTEAEWKSLLNPMEFQVLRNKATEPAFSSDLLAVKEPGIFVCAACGNELYRTADKFNSGTGWPSFDKPYKKENLIYRKDRSYGYSAIEVLCANCGGHLGHVFNDGPKETTGKRHCINGVALDFLAEDTK